VIGGWCAQHYLVETQSKVGWLLKASGAVTPCLPSIPAVMLDNIMVTNFSELCLVLEKDDRPAWHPLTTEK
jgi:hypothetical protein